MALRGHSQMRKPRCSSHLCTQPHFTPEGAQQPRFAPFSFTPSLNLAQYQEQAASKTQATDVNKQQVGVRGQAEFGLTREGLEQMLKWLHLPR